MPTSRDMRQFLGSQVFGKTRLPSVDLSGKTIVITGANTGLGFESAKQLARLNVSNLILACRNVQKGKAAMARIYDETECKGHTTIQVWEVDLDVYSSVLAFAHRIRTELERLDGFIANAGIEMIKYEISEGLERTLNINVVSTMLTGIAILPKLQETSERYNTLTNLTFTGSMVHMLPKESQLEFAEGQDILEVLSARSTAGPDGEYNQERYNLSKLFEHLCFNELSKKIKSRDVIVNVACPGWCETELSRNKKPPMAQRMMFSAIGRTAEEGGRALTHAVTAGEETTGCFLSDCVVKPQSDFVRSENGRQLQKRLWDQLRLRISKISPEVASFIC